MLLAVAALAACSGAAAEAELTDVTWTLTELEGSAPLADTNVHLVISADGSLAGSGGCNRYMGGVTFGDGEITFGPNLASTRMACEEAVMAQESAYLDLLERVSGYEIGGGELRLTDSNGNVLARFQAS